MAQEPGKKTSNEQIEKILENASQIEGCLNDIRGAINAYADVRAPNTDVEHVVIDRGAKITSSLETIKQVTANLPNQANMPS